MSDTLKAAEINGQPSFDDIRRMLRTAIFGDGELRIEGWIEEFNAENAIVRMNSRCFRYPYTLQNGAIELGAPVEVVQSWTDAKTPVQADEPQSGSRAFVTDLRGLQFSETQETVPIEVCRDGAWQHPQFGEVKVTPTLRESFVQNFTANVRKVGDLPLDYDHERGPAPGWIKGLRNVGTSLFADVSLTPTGKEKIRTGEYRFFSPEYHPDWPDPETGTKHGPTLFGGALTNKPFFRGMAAICCSEGQAATQGDAGRAASEVSPQSRGAGAEPHRPGKAMDPVTTGAQTATEPQNPELLKLSERLTAIEAENQALRVETAALQAREERNAVTQVFTEMTFGEGGRQVLAPASRTSLIEAVMALPKEHRQGIADAVKSLAFAELGERGFTPAETEQAAAGTLTASEEAQLRGMAERNGLKFEEVRDTYLENKKKNLQAQGRSA